MKLLNRTNNPRSGLPERVVQFGEGNFLRGFVDWMIHEMNEKEDFNCGVVVIQPIKKGLVKTLNNQDGLYTSFRSGIKNNKIVREHKIINCIQRGINPYENFEEYLSLAKNPNLKYVVSNTTEAGISYNPDDKFENTPPKSYPGKLTLLLYQRFKIFKGASDKGLLILPCELIDENGTRLKEIVIKYSNKWRLEKSFILWVKLNVVFYNTLVDSIVTGYPKGREVEFNEELGYRDDLIVEGEQFHLWVIQGSPTIKQEILFENCGLNVIFTDDLTKYRVRKVRILNGAHTVMVPVGYLYGIDNVKECIEDKIVGKFIKETIFNEICPTINFPKDKLDSFSMDVLDRFINPYISHTLMSISLNSIAKFKTRVLPTIIEYIGQKSTLPNNLVFSFSALIAFYRGKRNDRVIQLNDNLEALDFFDKQWRKTKNNRASIELMTGNILGKIEFWQQDLNKINGLKKAISRYLYEINSKGMKQALKEYLK